MTPDPTHVTLLGQKPHRDDGLHRFAQPHLVGENGFVARIQERHSVELVFKRSKWKIERLARENLFKRGLQQIVESVFQLYDVSRRADFSAGSP